MKVYMRTGDIINDTLERLDLDVIVHGCNCFCTMGSGIAKQISETFLEAYEADLATTPGDKSKLGTYTSHTYTFSKAPIYNHHLTIVNAYTQYDFGRVKDKCFFNYDAFTKLIKQFNIDFKGKVVGMPWIGCGLAGGNKNKVLDILEKYVRTFKCIIYELPTTKL